VKSQVSDERLVCPHCGEPLESALETLQCAGCDLRVPVTNGIPRFVADEYSASFGRQWNRYEVARPEEDAAVFRVKTGFDAHQLAGRSVLDAGCGGGRYTRLLAEAGARVTGVDRSRAVEKAADICSHPTGARFIQADLELLPLAEASFDFVFSIGVLHHGPRPKAAFHSIARRVKPGGSLAVWLYRKNTLPQELANRALRAVTTRMPDQVLEPACSALGLLGGIPLVNQSLNKIFNFSNHPDWVLRVCDNFDWYSPRFQSHHTLPELRSWFEKAGFEDLVELRPAKAGRFYEWAYDHDLLIGSGVNVVGRKKS
jgi:SAM-dependent methyltransferase